MGPRDAKLRGVPTVVLVTHSLFPKELVVPSLDVTDLTEGLRADQGQGVRQ